ncbi:MAG: glycosyltransferase, partial [Xanthomarina sp.]
MNKKVVILHPVFWKQAMGGAEIQIKYLVEFLLNNNIQVHYIFEDQGVNIGIVKHNELILHPLSKINLSKRFGNRWFLYKKRINKLLNQIQPDGIYTRFYSSWSGFAAEYAKKNNIPHIWALASNNDLKVLDKPLNFMKPLDFIENHFVRKAFKKATHIIVQNIWQEKVLLQKYKRKGVYLKQAAPTEQKHIPQKEKNLLSIVWIANLKPLKRPDHFIKIASLFRGQKDMKFEMVGRLDNRYKDQIDEEEKQNPNFNYLG